MKPLSLTYAHWPSRGIASNRLWWIAALTKLLSKSTTIKCSEIFASVIEKFTNSIYDITV